MPTFSKISLEEPTTVTAEMRTVVWNINSTNQQGEVLVLGDPESSAVIARVTQTAPASTMAGVGVRIISGPSSLADFPVRVTFPSTATDNPVTLPSTQQVRVFNSTAGDLLASVSQVSTVWAAQIDGRVRAQNSTIGDLLASVQQNSTTWAVQQTTGVHGARASTVGRASVTQSSTSVTLQTSNASRMGWTIVNNPNNGATLYVAFGGGVASTADFDVIVRSGGYYEMPPPVFFGEIRGVWDSTGTGFARTCEWRP